MHHGSYPNVVFIIAETFIAISDNDPGIMSIGATESGVMICRPKELHQ